jgi:glycosyltransferase involved in cell wall biosynthesis
LRVAGVGRLVPLKGFDLLIAAAAPFIREGKLTVDLIGDGPERSPLEALARDENLGDRVRFHGWLSHAKVQDVLSDCDIFAFPSLKELGGGSVLEAMAAGLVPIVLDYGGPGEIVGDDVGFRIPVGAQDAVIVEFRKVLAHLAENPAEIVERRINARAQAFDHFTWAAKAEKTLAVYKFVLGQGPRPNLPFPTSDKQRSRIASDAELRPPL